MEHLWKRLAKRAVFLFFICICFPFLQFPDDFNISKVGEWGGYCSSYYDVAVSGKYAYCVGRRGLDVVDISSPASPRLMASYPDSDVNYWTYARVELVNDHAYILYSSFFDSNLYIMDISDPTAPSPWGSLDFSDNARSLCRGGNYLYISHSYHRTIDIIDISGPIPPSTVITYNAAWEPEKLHVNGDYLYVATDGDGVQILDISTPKSPSIVSEIKDPDFWGDYSVDDICVVGNYAYILNADGIMFIYDVSAPESPVNVFEYQGYRFHEKLHVVDSLAFLWGQTHGLRILDVSDPSNPVLKVNTSDLGYYDSFEKVGSLVYIADIGSGLNIWDISDLTNPVRRGSLGNYGSANEIVPRGDYLYIGRSSGLQIMDVSDPSTPTHVGIARTSLGVSHLAVTDSYAFVTLGHDYDAFFQSYDISNPIRHI